MYFVVNLVRNTVTDFQGAAWLQVTHAADDATLPHATWGGHFETVKLLLVRKASIDAPAEDGGEALCNAAWPDFRC